jgi:hypothetical protein
MTTKNHLVLACLLFAACSGHDTTSQNAQRITCTITSDCAARGGTCVANECRANNECTSDADCTGGDICAPDPDFGGLCAAPGQPAAPLPAWSCSVGKDCPALEGCASDGKCHVDGECQNTWQPDGTLAGNCTGAGQICASSGENLDGYCTDGRGGPDPYCRSTGSGECRDECTVNDDCGIGGTCQAGFCHRPDECQTSADCTPNHFCGNPAGWDDYGYQFCIEDPSPTCVDDGHGACRLPCSVDTDCLDGGSCAAADHLCHASNECASDTDCATGQSCISDPEFGGLCGVPR